MKEPSSETHLFTYHKQSSYIGFICAMIFVVLLESVGVSYFLYKWSPILHWIHLSLSLSLMIFLICDLRAVIKHPISIKGDELSLKIGIRPRVLIKMSQINEMKNGNIHYEKDKKSKEVLDLSLLALAEPSFELVLDKPIQIKELTGKSRSISRIFFSVDQTDDFYRLIYSRSSMKKPS